MIAYNTIYHVDCLEGIEKLEDESINLVVTSPPYNLTNVSVHKKIVYNTYKDDMEFPKYIEWLDEIFKKLYNKLTKDGRVCINIGDHKNGAIPVHFYITQALLNRGYNYYTTIIWNKSQTSRRISWGSFKSPSCPSFPTPFEYILVFYKENRKLLHKGKTDLQKQEFIDWSLSLWNIQPEKRMKKFGHPAMFPEELPRRCIKMFSYVDDIILDPFSGMGTTCKVAKDLTRKYIGFDSDKKYVEDSIKRIG